MSWVVAPQKEVAPCLTALFGELMNQRQDGIADVVGLPAQQLEIERRDVAAACDLVGRLRRNDAAARLGARERDLHLGVALNEREVGKHRPHALGAERVAEQERVEDGGRGDYGHGRFLKSAGAISGAVIR